MHTVSLTKIHGVTVIHTNISDRLTPTTNKQPKPRQGDGQQARAGGLPRGGHVGDAHSPGAHEVRRNLSHLVYMPCATHHRRAFLIFGGGLASHAQAPPPIDAQRHASHPSPPPRPTASLMRYKDLIESKRFTDHIHNGHILVYTRVNPETGEIAPNFRCDVFFFLGVQALVYSCGCIGL